MSRVGHWWVATLTGIVVTATAHAASPGGGDSGLIKVLASGIPHSALFGLAFDGNEGVAVGGGGMILASEDAGASWKPVQHSATQRALLAAARRGAHTIAVGQMGVVMLEQEPGRWVLADSATDRRLLTVGVNAAGLAIAGGEFGTVLKSTDGGRSWTSAAPDWASMADPDHFGTGEPHIYAAVVDDSGQITIAGEFGAILRSDDGARTWRVIRPITAGRPTLHALHIEPAVRGNSFAVGQSGELLISADGGEQWQRHDSGTDHNFLGVAAAANGEVVVTGMRAMLRSGDGGRTWQQVEEGDTTTDWYQAVRAVGSSGKIQAVGHSGRIIQIGG